MSTNLQVVVGGQFGSEAKGHVTQDLLRAGFVHSGQMNVRVAGPNAGHTVYDQDGQKYAFRTVPVGAVIDPRINLVVSAGSEVDIDVLMDEVERCEKAGWSVRGRMFVDGEATLLEEGHKNAETNAELTRKVGSTGKGIGAARADRIMRGASRVKDDPDVVQMLSDEGIDVLDTAEYIRWFMGGPDQQVVIEGTQGFGLGLHAGFYPQCTSSDCRAVDFLAMAGISPWVRDTNLAVWVVCRAYPIRVAGNSGPLREETTWEALGLPEERTTVTNKVRRVGKWDPVLARRAVRHNGGAPTVRLALTMLDQMFPEVKGIPEFRDWPYEAQRFVRMVEDDAMAEVQYLAYGPNEGMFR